MNALHDIYDALLAHFGPQHWWPSRAGCASAAGKLEICVGAILTQNTNWQNVERALTNLRRARRLSIARLATLPPDDLAALIRPAGYFNVKACRLGAFIAHVRDAHAGDLAAMLAQPIAILRPELLAVHGIGPETADSMILYAGGQPSFVVDAYTRRVFLRHGLIDEASSDYDSIQWLCETSLPQDAALCNEYHALLVAVGKHFCKPTPRCEGCPLRGNGKSELGNGK